MVALADVPEDKTGFLEMVPLPAVVLDLQGVMVGHNARFLGLVGGATGNMEGGGGFSFLDPADREMAGSLLGRMAGDGSLTLRASLMGKDGERVKVLGFWSLLAPAGPRPARYIGLFVDISDGDSGGHQPEEDPTGQSPGGEQPDLKAAGSRADPAAAFLQAGEQGPGQADQPRRDQIHTIVFHDAKNRLAALHGYASLLREGLAGSEFLSYLDKLDEIASEVERDLGVASILSHIGIITPRWQNLRGIVMRAASRENGARISLDGLPGSLWCLADPLFPRVFSNLFENARRHGERVTRIRIAAREEEAGLLITVEDDGIGVPFEHKELIFELGFGRHTGYGLYLAREILAIAGFSIRETGDPGKGARFDIRIPKGRYLIHPKEKEPAWIPAT